MGYTLWWTNIAIENGHRNSGFSHEKWVDFPWQNVSSPEGILENPKIKEGWFAGTPMTEETSKNGKHSETTYLRSSETGDWWNFHGRCPAKKSQLPSGASVTIGAIEPAVDKAWRIWSLESVYGAGAHLYGPSV